MEDIALTETAADTVPENEHSLSYREVLKHPPVRVLAISRFASKMAASTLSYGVMVFLATAGASQFEVSLASSASYLAALLFGLQGGMLADSSPKRRVLYLSLIIQAGACFLIPFLFGTEIGTLLVIIFLTSALSQIVTPGLKSVVAIVATPAEVATTGALVNVLGSIGSAIGSSFVAPILINVSGVEAVLVMTGFLFLVSALRILKLPDAEADNAESLSANIRSMDWRPKALSLRYNAEWIVAHRPVASIVLVGIFCSALFEGFNSLIPVYVREVLDEDPAKSVYIFAPAAIGYLIGALGGPALIHWIGERKLAIVSIFLMVAGSILLGTIDTVDTFFARLSPLRLLEPIFDVQLSDGVLAAGVIAIPTNLGSTAADQAVQVYINKHVPVVRQGGMFGLQSVQENAFNLAAVFLLGLVATLVGPQYIFVLAPFIVGAIVLMMVRYSLRHLTGKRAKYGAGVEFLRGEADKGGASP
jgi:MFS family permease